MNYLAIAVSVVGVLCALDLLLTLGVIRRLRAHAERLSELSGGSDAEQDSDLMLAPGRTVGGFSAVATDGTAVALDLLDGPTLVGFFSPGCEPCRQQAPLFAEFAGAIPGGRSNALAVIVGSGEAAEDFARPLAGAARVVIEPAGGPVAQAFEVTGFPTMCLIDEHGVVQDTSYRVDRLTALATL